MLPLPERIIAVLVPFAALFTKPVWAHVQVLLAGKRSGNPILVNMLTLRETGPDSLQSGVHEWILQIVRCRNGVRFGKTTCRSGKPVG